MSTYVVPLDILSLKEVHLKAGVSAPPEPPPASSTIESPYSKLSNKSSPSVKASMSFAGILKI